MPLPGKDFESIYSNIEIRSPKSNYLLKYKYDNEKRLVELKDEKKFQLLKEKWLFEDSNSVKNDKKNGLSTIKEEHDGDIDMDVDMDGDVKMDKTCTAWISYDEEIKNVGKTLKTNEITIEPLVRDGLMLVTTSRSKEDWNEVFERYLDAEIYPFGTKPAYDKAKKIIEDKKWNGGKKGKGSSSSSSSSSSWPTKDDKKKKGGKKDAGNDDADEKKKDDDDTDDENYKEFIQVGEMSDGEAQKIVDSVEKNKLRKRHLIKNIEFIKENEVAYNQQKLDEYIKYKMNPVLSKEEEKEVRSLNSKMLKLEGEVKKLIQELNNTKEFSRFAEEDALLRKQHL